jgi:hypothetical protein
MGNIHSKEIISWGNMEVEFHEFLGNYMQEEILEIVLNW